MKNEIRLLLHLMAFLVYLLFKIYFPLDEKSYIFSRDSLKDLEI